MGFRHCVLSVVNRVPPKLVTQIVGAVEVKPALKKRQNPPLFNPFGVSLQRPVGGSMTPNIGGSMTAVSDTFTRCEPQPL